MNTLYVVETAYRLELAAAAEKLEACWSPAGEFASAASAEQCRSELADDVLAARVVEVMHIDDIPF